MEPHADQRLPRALELILGTDRCRLAGASRIERAAESLFGAGSRPAAILLTHDHPDHEGSALRLARTWDGAVYMHPKELPIATGDFAAMVASAMPLDEPSRV